MLDPNSLIAIGSFLTTFVAKSKAQRDAAINSRLAESVGATLALESGTGERYKKTRQILAVMSVVTILGWSKIAYLFGIPISYCSAPTVSSSWWGLSSSDSGGNCIIIEGVLLLDADYFLLSLIFGCYFGLLAAERPTK